MPCSAFRVKDEAGYILKNTMQEAGDALLKAVLVEVEVVIASSCAERCPRAFIF